MGTESLVPQAPTGLTSKRQRSITTPSPLHSPPTWSTWLLLILSFVSGLLGSYTLRHRPFIHTTAYCGSHDFSTVTSLSARHPTRLYGRRAASIARTKGRNDSLKAALYARFGKNIINAVKSGGPDERVNTQLRDLIVEAKAANVPMANITSAINRGSQQDTAAYREVVYEAYGKGGAGLIITALTDNVNRAFEKVSGVISWSGLTMAKPGGVAFKFQRKAAIFLEVDLDEDQLIEIALEAGVDDAQLEETDDGEAVALTDVKDGKLMRDALLANKIGCGGTRLLYWPLNREGCTPEDETANRLAISRLLALDDVDWVDHSMP